MFTFCNKDLEVNISGARRLTQRSFNSQNSFAVAVFHHKVWIAPSPNLFNATNHISRRRWHFYRLQTAWEAATHASQRSMEVHHLCFARIKYLHAKWTNVAKAITSAAIALFSSPKHLCESEISSFSM